MLSLPIERSPLQHIGALQQSTLIYAGIGGVHRGAESTMDVSADLTELSRTPIAVVSAGVKSILDIPRTLEVNAHFCSFHRLLRFAELQTPRGHLSRCKCWCCTVQLS